MFYLVDTASHAVIFHDGSQAAVEQYLLNNPNPAYAVAEIAEPAYAMMAQRQSALKLWQHGVKPLLEWIATFPDPTLVAEDGQLDTFLTLMGVDAELAEQQSHAYVLEKLRPRQPMQVERVQIDLETGQELPVEKN